MDMGPCSSCNPFGEIILEVQCPQSVAIDGVCQFELTSSDPLTLAIEVSIHTVRPPSGFIIAPTNANLPGGNVTITTRRLNDNAFNNNTYRVQDTCQ